MKKLEEFAPAAKILAALASPLALLVIEHIINSDGMTTIDQIETGDPVVVFSVGVVKLVVDRLAECEIIIKTGESFSQPEPRYLMLNEDMPDLARVVIEAIWSDQPRPGDVALTAEGPTFMAPLVNMSVVTPGYNQPAVTVTDAPIILEVNRRKISIKPYGKYVNRAHIDMFSRAIQDLLADNKPAEMRLYVEKWNAARDTVNAPVYDFAVDLDYPEAPWNG